MNRLTATWAVTAAHPALNGNVWVTSVGITLPAGTHHHTEALREWANQPLQLGRTPARLNPLFPGSLSLDFTPLTVLISGVEAIMRTVAFSFGTFGQCHGLKGFELVRSAPPAYTPRR